MINKMNKSKQTGTFTLPSGKDVYGELTLAGQDTSLYIQDKDYFDTDAIHNQYVKGVLRDLTKVTLLQCITPPEPGYRGMGEQRHCFADIFPHFVVYGNLHIDPSDKKITAVHFIVDDATTLFYDFDAFGSLIDARPFIKQITQAKGLKREIEIGPDPQILYFTGKHEIFVADTLLGRVSASHHPSHTLGGPSGVYLKNTIFVNIAFREAVTFNDTIARVSTLLRYLELLVGRPQNLLELNINIESDEEQPVFLQIYWSMPPKRETSHEDSRPHPADVLLDAVRQSTLFSNVLGNWLKRQQDWKDARIRFSNSFAKQHSYSIERLIGSTNMFDILPSSAVASDIQLSEDLKCAKEDCRMIFNNLPQSPERDSVLSALGRVGKSGLKHKIRHRSQFLIDKVGERFPDLSTVTDEAVNCRNHYVHGSEPKFDYNGNFDAVIFFTNTLEFVFAASDLIEAGWDVKTWCKSHSSHPFAQYRADYAGNLKELKNLIPQHQIKEPGKAQPNYVDFMCRLHKEVLALVRHLRFDKKHPWHFNLVSLYGTLIELLGSACILIREGAAIGIPILLRSALEAYLDFVNLAKDRKYGYHMRAAELKEWLKLLQEAKTEQNPFLAGIANTSNLDQELSQQGAELEELNKDGYAPLRQDQKFDKAGLTPVYKSVYNSLCCYSHNNIRALQSRHFNITPDKTDFTVEYNAPLHPDQLLSYIDSFCSIVTSSTETIHRILETDVQGELQELRSQWEGFRKELQDEQSYCERQGGG